MTRKDLEAQLPALRDRLVRYAERRAPAGHAEDAVQEALLRTVESVAVIRGADATPWAVGILRNVLREAWRRQPRRAAHVPLAEATEEAPAPLTVAAAQETVLEARAALRLIAALPTDRRRMVVDIVAGMPVAEAAAAHGIAPGTVRSRTHRALQGIRAALAADAAPRRRAA